MAGTTHLTLADLSILATYSSMELTKGVYVDLELYPESRKWAAKMRALVPNYEKVCGEGTKVFGVIFEAKTGW